MKFEDVFLAIFICILVFGLPTALTIYAYKRGKQAFKEKLDELDSPFQARWKALSTSFRAAIIPALFILFGRLRARAVTNDDQALAWECAAIIGGALIVFVIVPFVVGVFRAYGLCTREQASNVPKGIDRR